MRRVIVWAFLGMAGLLAQTFAVFACSPMPERFVSPFEKIDKADHVYVGRVSLASKNDWEAAYEVEVVKSFIGDAGTTVRFKSRTAPAACGFLLRDGYYIFYQPSGLITAKSPQFLPVNSQMERFDTAEDALAAAAHYLAVMKAAETAPPIEIRSQTDAAGNTVARLHAPEPLRTRIEAALAGMNGCIRSYIPRLIFR